MRIRTVLTTLSVCVALSGISNVVRSMLELSEQIGNISKLKKKQLGNEYDVIRSSLVASLVAREPTTTTTATTNQPVLINTSDIHKVDTLFSRNSTHLFSTANHHSMDTQCRDDVRRPAATDIDWVEDVWQRATVEQVSGKKRMRRFIYVYSAHYDDRQASGPLPSVRVLVLSTLSHKDAVHCALWFDHSSSPLIVKAAVNAVAGSGYAFQKQNHLEHAYICRLPTFDAVPTAVSVHAGNATCWTRYTTMVPVNRFLRTDNPKIEFGVCVTVGYGYIAPEVIVEWMELNRMFGVAEVNLYDNSYAKNMSATFDYYTRRGVLTVRRLPHPRQSDKSGYFNKVRNVRVTALNDCQLRNMYKYRYIIVIDTDEVIVPRTTSNYSALITELNRQRKFVTFNYIFLNIFFLLDFAPDTTQPSYLRTIQYRNRVGPKGYGYAPKSFVDPRQCSVLFNHYCTQFLARATPRWKRVHNVPFNAAASHHYRRCGRFYKYSCKQLYAEKTLDDSLLPYRDRLRARVEPVLKELYGTKR